MLLVLSKYFKSHFSIHLSVSFFLLVFYASFLSLLNYGVQAYKIEYFHYFDMKYVHVVILGPLIFYSQQRFFSSSTLPLVLPQELFLLLPCAILPCLILVSSMSHLHLIKLETISLSARIVLYCYLQ